jgi:hypothetical protein
MSGCPLSDDEEEDESSDAGDVDCLSASLVESSALEAGLFHGDEGMFAVGMEEELRK